MVDSLVVIVPACSKMPPLSHPRRTRDETTGLVTHTGLYEGLRVRVRPDGEVSLRGSLAAYHFGSNVRTMTRADARAAVASLAHRFGLDPSECRVYRLDLAASLEMHRPVACYLSVLNAYARMQRVDYHGESVSFRSAWRWISFYDKCKQAGVEGTLLRFEVQYKRNVKRQLGLALTLADLADPSRFEGLVGRWLGEYEKVTKRQRPRITPTSKRSDLRRQFASAGLRSMGGAEVLFPIIDGWDLERRQAHILREEVRALTARGDDTNDGALIRELDAAVAEAARYVLAN